jgi:hypothetical protein
MTMTIQALSSHVQLSARPARRRFFLRRLVEALIDGRQHKADLHVAEYLDRHPEYRSMHTAEAAAVGGEPPSSHR